MLYPVILSGGSGTRLWPLSREDYPKQFQKLTGDLSLLQHTALRVKDTARYHAPIIICNEAHRFIVAEQLRALDITPKAIVLEPEGRNTAPAAALAALIALTESPDAQLFLLPSDHYIQNVAAFGKDVASAAALAAKGKLVTFGITPSAPETGYGYIHKGKGHKVRQFVEKPDAKTAKSYVKSGDYYWNSGMFLFPAALYLQELNARAPEMVALCKDALGSARDDLDFTRPDAAIFKNIRADSIDYAVMEHTHHAAVIAAGFDWQDLGAWDALGALGTKDKAGNVVQGSSVALDCRNAFLRSDGPLVAAIGLDDVMVIATSDAVLVAPKNRAQQVKELVGELKKQGRTEATSHRLVYRPWGFYEGLYTGNRFQVKRLMVKPGGRLSLQKHQHRAEHWVVVEGTAHVTRDNQELTVKENESVYIPIGSTHRIENKGTDPLTLIEVQSGNYLGEDDIVRLDDVYGRT